MTCVRNGFVCVVVMAMSKYTKLYSHRYENYVSEPSHEKTSNLGFRPGPTQTGLYSHRSRLEACNFGFKKKRNCSVCVVKTKA